MIVDFERLAKPQMIEDLDFETLLLERKTALIELWDAEEDQDKIRAILDRESEPLTKFLQENVYRELILRHRINTAAQSTLLAFANGSDLDAVVANFAIERLVVVPATGRSPAVMESDANLRERAQMAFEALNTAGSENSYRYHALSADGRVADVSVVSPSPAQVTVAILQKDSDRNEASDELVAVVANALNAEDIRPIADRVTVMAAGIIEYSIEAELYIGKDPQVATLLDNAHSSIRDYTSEQKRIGRSVHRSAIYAALHIKGVDNVIIKKPTADINLTATQAGYCTEIKLTVVSQ